MTGDASASVGCGLTTVTGDDDDDGLMVWVMRI